MNDNYPICRYCKNKVVMEIEYVISKEGFGGKQGIFWMECPMCGSRSPISNTEEGALEYAVNGYE